MIDVCFVKTGKAFIPEAAAYCGYLRKNGLSAQIAEGEGLAKKINARLYFRFGGFLRGTLKKGVPEIHEYHTASVGKLAKTKNLMKSIFSSAPVCYSFLNEYVEQEYYFSQKAPCFYRDMGASKELLSLRNQETIKYFDICYFGSISDRVGLVNTVIRLSEEGYTIVLGGRASQEDKVLFKKHKNITFLGVCSREKVYEYMGKSRFGLNFMPNQYPLNQQTSTKVIEYLVSGLPIISNSYQWINEHSKKLGYEYITMDKNKNIILLNDEKDKYILPVGQAELLTWDSILERCEFEKIIRHCMVK